MFGGTALAVELSQANLTVLANESGETAVLSLAELEKGQKIFINSSCTQCHLSGGTKTNPNVSLSAQDLASASPARNNLESLVDYIYNPTDYSGELSLDVLHPNPNRADIFFEMRDLTKDDVKALAGYILFKAHTDDSWGNIRLSR